MKILAWNCRDLACRRTVTKLQVLDWHHKPDLLILFEKMNGEDNLRSKLKLFRFFELIYTSPLGRSEGFYLAWNSGIYRPLVASDKRNFWDSLPTSMNRWPKYHLMMSDFNGVLCDEELWNSSTSLGGSVSSYSATRNCISMLEMIDLGASDPQFTLCHRRVMTIFTQAHQD
ncbi:Endonuclease/exonuclease/phosphatase [Parasponia andersonii]|uniref:Endonuclease/exonuclease/phosphatase n=1 Tax=Parasponia andersonii TaxID=3476 RepID=A0A2P5AM05_PARAD|nr:Endonuclease/exonuclease/phosphatase [Parasponia andersonii]